ncbi:MAG: PQQ-binding-like beta-propeller repeat protein [Pirellulales bacterium]
MQRPARSNRLAVAFFAAIAVSWAIPVAGQLPPPGGAAPRIAQQRRPAPQALAQAGQNDPDLLLDGVFLPPDRTAKRRLESAEEMIGERRYGEAVRLLGGVLENGEDFFFKPDPAESVFKSLKADAGRLIAELPEEGRQSYELQFGARARTMLQEAVASGKASNLADVARQFFYTAAGQEATFLLGRHHLDHNRPTAAALCFERLRKTPAARERLEPVLSLSLAVCWLRAGNPEQATSALLRLKRAQPGAEVTIGGKTVRLFADDAQAAAWLRETFGPQGALSSVQPQRWALFRGDESRNAESAGGRPLLNVRWRQPTTDDAQVERFVENVRRDYINQEIVAIPSFQPLGVGDVVLMRSAFALQAVDFTSGKIVWRYPESDESLSQFLEVGSSPQPGRGAQVLSGLDQRMWEDAIYGTLSSDGDQVYYVEDLGLGVTGSPLTTVLPNGRRVLVNSRTSNRLAARELATQGKLKWEVGGADGGDEPQLAGAYFLGPPLPLLGQLYALAEMKGQEIRLVVLSPENGALAWSQQLAVVDPPVTQDATRRNAGAVPSFADGVLVCPTSAGAVVAIDLTTRSLLWGYQYPRTQQNNADRFNAARFAIYPGSERRGDEHWIDGSITVAEGSALVTPVESDQIYCLHLLTGKELWKQDRDDHLYVACVHDGRVVLVGRNAVSAVKLADGESAWPDLELPAGSLPSGRGFYSGNFYYLPLTTAEVAKIDLTTGQIVERARSRSGTVPGNLICFRDSVVSQGADHVEVFYQLDALKQQIAESLAKRPDDAEALALSAAVKLDEQSLGDAIELLERSYALTPADATREQLIHALLEGLRVDFAANRQRAEELDGLIQRREDRQAYWRVMAAGLQANGELVPAFQTYLKLVDDGPAGELDVVDPALSVDRVRWISAQLEALQATASAAQRDEIEAAIAARLEAALTSGSVAALRQFLSVFGHSPAAMQARTQLLARLDSIQLLEAEALVRSIDRAGPTADNVAAHLRLAKLLDSAGRHDLAAVSYGQLAKRLADVAGPDGLTGKQLVDQLPADHPARAKLGGLHNWPAGEVKARESSVAVRPRSQRAPRSVDLDVIGSGGSFFRDLSLSLDLQTQVLVGQDAYGEKQFRIPIYEQRMQPTAVSRFNVYNAPPLSSVNVHGGMLVLSMGNQVVAIDAMRGSEPAVNRVLWTQDLGERIAGFQTGQGIYSRPVAVPWGGTRFVPEDTFGRRYGNIGPVTDQGVYFQRLRDLHCVDPHTGKTMWIRKNVGLGNQLFGDDELLFVAPTSDAARNDQDQASDETVVLRAATGEQVGSRQIVPFEQRMLTIGRQVLCWEPQGAQHLLALRDPWEEKTLWSFAFENGAKAAIVGDEAVGVLEPDGDFVLVTLADGKPLVKDKVEPEKALVGIYLLPAANEYLLITNSASPLEVPVNVQPVAGAANYPMVNGRVYAFDRSSGKKAWPAPAVVAQHGLVTNQPSQLPLLVFVRQVGPRRGPGPREPRTSLMCLDKRTGRVAYQNEELPHALLGNLEVSGDRTKNTMSLLLPPRVIELTLTDVPPPTTPAK